MNHLLARTAIAAAALLCATAASAVTVDFESFNTTIAPAAPLLRDGDYLIQGGYFVNTQAQQAGSSAVIARLSLGTDPASCLNGACPSGDATRFLSVLDGGIVHLGKLDWSGLTFGSLGAAAIPASATPAGSTVYLVIEADRDDGSYGSFAYTLNGAGKFQTITSATVGTLLDGTGTLSSGTVTDFYLYSYVCSDGACDYLKAGFAVDNIRLDEAPEVSAVPESSSWLLMAAGLGVVGAISRRRRP